MTRRWTIAQLLRVAIPVALIALVIVGIAELVPQWSRNVTVTIGPALGDSSHYDDPHASGDSTLSFDIVAEVRDDHSVLITETIVQWFDDARHGIERVIPLSDDDGNHAMRSLEVSTSPGTPGDVELFDEGDSLSIRIGDPAVTITGPHAYRLTYVLENVVTTLDDGTQRVRLDALDGWEQPIDEIRHTVVAADGTAALATACWSGPRGSTDPCQTDLAEGLAYTTQVDFASGTFAAAAAVMSPNEVSLARGVAIALVVAVGVAYSLTRHRERSTRRIASRLAAGVTTTDPAAIEFSPPFDLDPACALRLERTSRADLTRLLTATLVDLIADGVLLASHVEGSAADWQIREGTTPPRTPYETTLVTAVMGDEDEVLLSARGTEIGLAMAPFAAEVDAELRARGLLGGPGIAARPTSRSASAVWFVTSCVLALVLTAGAVVVGSTFLDQRWLLGIGGVLGVTVIVLRGALYDHYRMMVYTDDGRAAVWRLEGFRRFFEQSEFTHAEAADRMGMFREYMGHAAAFGALDRWVQAMPVADDASRQEWGSLALISHSTVWTAAQRAALPRSSNGSSSSSGGFSGGGSGGGGGGSW